MIVNDGETRNDINTSQMVIVFEKKNIPYKLYKI